MGSLADFSLPDGTLNPAALLQAAGLLNAMQNNSRGAAQEMLQQSGPARIIVWTWFPETLPPDLCVILDGSDMYVVIIGTMNAEQWLSQIAGATATPYPPQPSISVGAFWYPISQDIQVQLAGLAVPGITRPKIVGHSYGAAIALLVALNFAQNPGQLADVQALLFGGPNPLTGGYTGALPSALHRVAIAGDVVPILPPAGFDAHVPHRAVVDAALGYGPQWAYYGRGWTLAEAGGVTANPALRPELSAALAAIAAGNLTLHRIEHYTGGAVQTYAAQGGEPATRRWLPLAARQAGIPNPQTPAAPIPQASWVNVPGANQVYFPGAPPVITEGNLGSIQSVTLNAANVSVQSGANIHDRGREALMATWSGFARLTYFINNGRYGRQMRTTLSGVASIAEGFNQAKTLGAVLAGCLGNAISAYPAPIPGGSYPKGLGTPVIEFVRVADALNPRVSQLFTLGGVNYAGFSGGKSADFQATALSLRLPGASIQTLPPPAGATTFQHFGNFLFCGQPDDCVQAGAYVPGIVLRTGTTMDVALAGLLNYLSNAAPQFGFMGLDYTQPLFATGVWTIFNVNFWQFTVTGHGWQTGDRVKVTGANSLGFDGAYKINVIDANTISLTNGPRTGLPAPTQANVRRIQTRDGARFLAFYRYQIPPGGWNTPFGIKISKKNPGREFLGVSFTKRKRRPK